MAKRKKSKDGDAALWITADDRNPRGHNYTDKVLAALEGRQLEAGVTHAHVCHDDWCAIFKGGYCNCDPDITFETDRGRRD